MRSDGSHTRHEMSDDVFKVIAAMMNPADHRCRMTPSRIINNTVIRLRDQVTSTEVPAPEKKMPKEFHGFFIDEVIDQSALLDLLKQARPSISTSPSAPRECRFREKWINFRTL